MQRLDGHSAPPQTGTQPGVRRGEGGGVDGSFRSTKPAWQPCSLPHPLQHREGASQRSALPHSLHIRGATPTVGLTAQKGLGMQSGRRSGPRAPDPQRPAGLVSGHTQLLNELGARCSHPFGIWDNNVTPGGASAHLPHAQGRLSALPVVQGMF